MRGPPPEIPSHGRSSMEKVASVQEYFDRLGERFIAEAAKGVNAVIAYDLSADGSGQFHFAIDDGQLGEVQKGLPEKKATITITMKGEHFLAMSNGDLDGAKAYMTRKMKVKGKIPMAQKMKKFLPPTAK